MRYFINRLIQMPLMILLISFVAFILINLTPSDPAVVALRINDVELTPEVINQMRTELGLDKPFLVRYANWLWQILHFDFGQSYITQKSVLDEIKHALPTTLSLAFSALGIIIFISLSLALLSIQKPNGWLDNSIRAVLFFFTAVPNYWLALLLIWAIALQLDWLPVSGLDSPSGIILPAITLSLGYIGIYFRLLRGAMLQQMAQPYVFYGLARGLSRKRLLFRHILPNSLHTSLTGIGMSIPKLLAGSVAVENIFALPGLGRLCLQAIFSRDYPMIQAYILLMAILFLLFNFVIDLIQHQLDPRLAEEKND